jgi:threonine/homoserine/homoserine lactone efflux protein
MDALIGGFAIALVVSLPPGPNTALLVDAARGGMRRTLPIVAGAALTDGIYALLASVGVLGLHSISADLSRWIAATCCLIAASVLWFPRERPFSSRAAIGFALLNPSTAALWVGLSAVAVAHPKGLNIFLWAFGVIAGTTTWFVTLAYLATRAHRRLTFRRQILVQRGVAAALVVVAAITLL